MLGGLLRRHLFVGGASTVQPIARNAWASAAGGEVCMNLRETKTSYGRYTMRAMQVSDSKSIDRLKEFKAKMLAQAHELARTHARPPGPWWQRVILASALRHQLSFGSVGSLLLGPRAVKQSRGLGIHTVSGPWYDPAIAGANYYTEALWYYVSAAQKDAGSRRNPSAYRE